MRVQLLVGATLLSFTLALNAGRPLNYKVEATSEHYGSRGVCIGYKVPANSLVTGYFRIVNPHPTVRTSVLVFEKDGSQPFSQQDLNGEARFSFRSRGNDAQYEACIRALPKTAAPLPPGTVVDATLSLVWNFDLFDEDTAKAVVLEPIEKEFYQLEESIGRLARELSMFQLNEAEMRDTNENTLDRLHIFTLLSVLVLVGLGVYQLVYLKRFFRTKKLI